MKKIISSVLLAALLVCAANVPSMAAESWREAFVTRIMKVMSSDPTYNTVAITDLDSNGIPEAFILRDGADGGISAGFTMNGSSISSIEIPGNIIGTCLSDITVYNDDGRLIFVGCEIPRHSSVINYYKLMFDGKALKAQKILKSYVNMYPTVPYSDIYGRDFLTNGYPNRTKIKNFIDSYDSINVLTATNSNAKFIIDGESVEIAGYTVNDSNYYKIRDIAMLLRTTPSRFDVSWDPNLGGVTISRGVKYTIVGGELSGERETALNVNQSSAPVYVDGGARDMMSYNINGNTYFKIRDISDMIGFSVDWDGAQQAVIIRTE